MEEDDEEDALVGKSANARRTAVAIAAAFTHREEKRGSLVPPLREVSTIASPSLTSTE